MTTQAIAQATPSLWEAVSHSASEAVSWLGHQVSAIGTALKGVALKVAAFASQAFAAVRDFVAPYLKTATAFLITHQKEVLIGSGVLAIGVAIGLFLASRKAAPAAAAPAAAAPAPAPAAAAAV